MTNSIYTAYGYDNQMASLAMALHQDNWIQRYLAPDLPGFVNNYLGKVRR
jgi:hypothetical protein